MVIIQFESNKRSPLRSTDNHVVSSRVRIAIRLRPRNAEEQAADADFAYCVELQPQSQTHLSSTKCLQSFLHKRECMKLLLNQLWRMQMPQSNPHAGPYDNPLYDASSYLIKTGLGVHAEKLLGSSSEFMHINYVCCLAPWTDSGDGAWCSSK